MKSQHKNIDKNNTKMSNKSYKYFSKTVAKINQISYNINIERDNKLYGGKNNEY